MIEWTDGTYNSGKEGREKRPSAIRETGQERQNDKVQQEEREQVKMCNTEEEIEYTREKESNVCVKYKES